MSKFFFFVILGICHIPFLSFSQQLPNRYDSLRGSLNTERACFDVTYYDLALSIDIHNQRLQGINDVYFNVLKNTNTIQLDLFNNLIIDSIYFNNTYTSFKRDSNAFFITFPTPLIEGNKYKVSIYYEGNPIIAKKAPWDGGWVFSKDSLNRPWVGVACEGIGASLWWPMKDHLSDEPDSMRMHYTVPSSLMAIGNGVLESTTLKKNTTTYNWKVNYPINSYNVTCNIATYVHLHDTHIQDNKDTLAIDYYVLDYNEQRATEHFKQVHPMLRCYEKYFGPYPFFKDGYAMVETPYWGMEHQGAIAYGNDYTNKIIDFDYIIIHESAHEWWGNNISVKDHAEMWIHESFTTYAENLLVEYIYGFDMSIRYLNLNKPYIKNVSPIVGPLDINYEGWGDSDMYYKGAWILHTFRTILNNDSLWFSILKEMQTDFALKTVSTTDIIQYINTKTGRDYSWFFNQYLFHAKPPILEFYYEKNKKNMRVFYRWTNTAENFSMEIPMQTNSGVKTFITPTLEMQYIDVKRKTFDKNIFDQNYNYFLLVHSKSKK
jgi:aminopeptidase N